MMKKTLLITALIAIVALAVHAQQPLTPTQYGQIRANLNPAASLMAPKGEISVIGRRQWVGLDGAPTVFWGSGHMGFERLGATVASTSATRALRWRS